MQFKVHTIQYLKDGGKDMDTAEFPSYSDAMAFINNFRLGRRNIRAWINEKEV